MFEEMELWIKKLWLGKGDCENFKLILQSKTTRFLILRKLDFYYYWSVFVLVYSYDFLEKKQSYGNFFLSSFLFLICFIWV